MEQSKVSKATELKRVAHMLDRDLDDLSYLDKLKTDELLHLKDSLAEKLLNEHAETWEKLASVSRFMPNFLNAKIAQDVFGPSLTANFTYFLPVKQAIQISSYFSKEFMADVSEHLNPSRLEALLKELSINQIQNIISELESRDGYFTMGHFLDYMPQDKIIALSAQMKSQETLIRTAAFCNKKERLVPVLLSLSADKIIQLLMTADKLNLSEEVLRVLSHIPKVEYEKYGQLLGRLEKGTLDSILAAVKRVGGEEFLRLKAITESGGLRLD